MPRDQRGQPCRAFVPPLRLVVRWETRRAREGAAAAGGMPRAVFREGLWGTTFTRRSCLFFGAVTLVCLAALVVLLAVAARLLPPPSPGWFMVQFAAPLATFALVPLGVRGQIRLNWRRWTSLVAARGHCPSCGYALINLPEEDDGCRVCAECGGAWRVRGGGGGGA